MHADYILQYIVFGQKRFFDEALFSIASAWYYLHKSKYKARIVVYTDDARPFKNLPITIEELKSDDWQKWAGQDHYTYRGKIICIKECIKKYDLPTIFIDTDTYFLDTPDVLFDQLKAGNNLLHFNEGLPSKYLRGQLQQPEIKNWIHKNINHSVNGQIWNSGVIGLSTNSHNLIDKVIEFNDLFFRSSRYFATEQFAFSVVLDDKTSLKQANKVVFHYWHASLKKVFQQQFKKMETVIGAYNMDKWAASFHQFTPHWPIWLSPGIRIRAYLYKLGLFKKFRSLSPMFFKNQN